MPLIVKYDMQLVLASFGLVLVLPSHWLWLLFCSLPHFPHGSPSPWYLLHVLLTFNFFGGPSYGPHHCYNGPSHNLKPLWAFRTRWIGGCMFIPIPSGTIYPVIIALVSIHPPLSISGTYNRFHNRMEHNITQHQNITPFSQQQKHVQQERTCIDGSRSFTWIWLWCENPPWITETQSLKILEPTHKPSKVECNDTKSQTTIKWH